ncbi:hypothetical protein [Micromonospora sp. NPDC002575]|uniref:hypothetical protein n=1 Tax=Micromonospora sp. NPDC002575 TaxID=3364222 RepID=UPI0036C5296F
MDHVRISTVVLTCVSVLALAACGGEEPASTAAPTSAAATTAAASPTADAASPTAAAPASADPAADKKLCETAKKIGDDSKAALVKAVSSGSGDPTPALKKAYTEMAEGMATATGGSGSEVATALAEVGAEAGKIANAADLRTAADDPGLEKAGAKANAACKKVGVDPNL